MTKNASRNSNVQLHRIKVPFIEHDPYFVILGKQKHNTTLTIVP